MGICCYIEPVKRAPISRARATELVARVGPRLEALDWRGGEPLVLRAETLTAGEMVSVKLDIENPDDAWAAACQCVAVALMLSRELPEWSWSVSDDLEMLKTNFGELLLEAGRAVSEDARLRAELDVQIDEAARWLLDGEKAKAAEPSVEVHGHHIPEAPVVGKLWIGPAKTRRAAWADDDEDREDSVERVYPWRAVVPLRNPLQLPVDSHIEIDLYDRDGVIVRTVGVWTVQPHRLAVGEAREHAFGHEDRLKRAVTAARVRVRYIEEHTFPVELLEVQTSDGIDEHCSEPVASPVRARRGRIEFGPTNASGEQEIDCSFEVETERACKLAPKLRVYTRSGGILRQATQLNGLDVPAGRSRPSMTFEVKPVAQPGRVTCTVEARIVAFEDPLGALTIVDKAPLATPR